MKKILLSTVVATMFLTSSLFVSAQEQVVTSPGVATVQVTADIVSTFEVKIPDVVEITERGVKEFDIVATGNISSLETLDLTIPEYVTMTTEQKDPMNLPLACDIETFTAEQLAVDGGTTAKCSVDASNITAGIWTGTAEITVQLTDTTITP